MTGTPNDVAPGWVCRIRLAGGGITYTSARVSKDAAWMLADSFERTAQNGAADPAAPVFVTFPGENGPVKVRRDKITSIEAVPVAPYRRLGADIETRPATSTLTRR